MKDSWYVPFIGLLVLLLTSACSSPEPGMDWEFLESLEGKLLLSGCFSGSDFGLHVISLGDSFEPLVSFSAVDGRSIGRGPADLSFDGSQIVVVAAAGDGTGEIYVTRIDNGGWQQVTYNSWTERDLAWSPDGTRIAFSFRAEDTNGNGVIDEEDAIEIYTIGIDDSDLQQVTRNGGRSTDPRWSPDGKRLAYRLRLEREAKRMNGLYLINLRTGENRELHPALGGAAPVSWSPDGRYIAVAGPSGTKEPLWAGTDIYLIDVETGEWTKITDTHQYTPYHTWDSGGIWLSNAVWSPDGEAIAFAWTWTDWDKHAIFVVSRDGSRLSQLTEWSESYQIPLSWRP